MDHVQRHVEEGLCKDTGVVTTLPHNTAVQNALEMIDKSLSVLPTIVQFMEIGLYGGVSMLAQKDVGEDTEKGIAHVTHQRLNMADEAVLEMENVLCFVILNLAQSMVNGAHGHHLNDVRLIVTEVLRRGTDIVIALHPPMVERRVRA